MLLGGGVLLVAGAPCRGSCGCLFCVPPLFRPWFPCVVVGFVLAFGGLLVARRIEYGATSRLESLNSLRQIPKGAGVRGVQSQIAGRNMHQTNAHLSNIIGVATGGDTHALEQFRQMIVEGRPPQQDKVYNLLSDLGIPKAEVVERDIERAYSERSPRFFALLANLLVTSDAREEFVRLKITLRSKPALLTRRRLLRD